MIKTRLQVSGNGLGMRNYQALGIGGTVSVIAAEEGVVAFWRGIGAAWMREASYTSLRIGLYDPIKTAMGLKQDSSFFLKFAAGSLSGAIGTLAGNPFDVLKTRMMASEQSISLRRLAFDVHKAQGMFGFYKGFQANVMRAMVLNGTNMACYEQIKSLIANTGILSSNLAIQFCSAFGAGFFMAVTVTPFDMIRTQLMNQRAGVKAYNGFVDCALQIVRKNGPKGLYAGFVPIWARFAPTTTLQLVFFEQMKVVLGLGKQ